jgi:ADP-L-glycero-D-manno-heptose 6-epimerase
MPKDVKIVLHFGAIADTLNSDSKLFYDFNVLFSTQLIKYCALNGVYIINASSASVYGNRKIMSENCDLPTPPNLYAESKLLIDNFTDELYVDLKSPYISIRLFNIYGKSENNKGSMSSIVWKFSQQIISSDFCTIFKVNGREPGKQARDFVFVSDLCRFIEILIREPKKYGIINFGSGIATEFYELAEKIFKKINKPVKINFIEMPKELMASYQWFTNSEKNKFNLNFPNFDFTQIGEGIEIIINYLVKLKTYEQI